MKNRAIEYPHPVLNEFTNDFNNCAFNLSVGSHSDTGNSIDIEFSYSLTGAGIQSLISQGLAKVFIRVVCFRTSFRKVFEMNNEDITVISLPKKNVTDSIDISASIVATQNINNYCLPEFNQDYFGGYPGFKLRKGDIIANEPRLTIKLNTILEKNMAGVVFINSNSAITEPKVYFASVEETDPSLTDYITISLPDSEYKNYAKLSTKKHLKNVLARFLQGALVFPAITEAVARLRREEELEEDPDCHYRGTIWAESLYNALNKMGIEELATCNQSDFEIANKLLGDVVGDSINTLMQKMIDWSTIQQEDEAL
ncbi:hypothetical protein [Ruminococcus sp.]|uniref:hypothetical protein n=1 Tax=Ruminococcus sp. TaxID=41978 RepID=UPI00388D6874